MRRLDLTRLFRPRRERQRGQALVEIAFVIPIVLVLVVSVAELGLIYGKLSSLGYGTREGARSGSALALGDSELCTGANRDPSNVDAVLVSAVQRILDSPDSGIDLARVQQIRIFEATSTGAEVPNTANVWNFVGEGNGPEVDPGPGSAFIAFGPTTVVWPACDRVNTGPNPDSIGVSISYLYEFVTPLPAFINALAGGSLTLTLTETTVMALNPTV
jgi:hypothetical protein